MTQRTVGYLGDAYTLGRKEIEVNARSVMDSRHTEIHRGNSFLVQASTLFDINDVYEVWCQTPNSDVRAHAALKISSSLPITLAIWFPTTKTYVSENQIVPINRDMDSTNSASILVCHTPGGSQAGDAFQTLYLGGGKDTLGGIYESDELILPKDQTFLLKITSRADNNSILLALNWYERDLSELS